MTRRESEGLVLETSPLLTASHGFTTRIGGVSVAPMDSLNIGFGRGDESANVIENYNRLGRAVGFDPDRAILTRQIHGDTIRRVTAVDAFGIEAPRQDCDALITDLPGTTLVIFTADCIPVLFHDPVTGAVGAAHCGWRGTALGLAAKTVRAMCEAYGCDAANIRTAIGPGISTCCFETDADVPEAMRAALGEAAEPYLHPAGEKWHVDLKAINAHWLRSAGVREIDISDSCTACDPTLFWSHRRMGAARGSQGAVIVCGGV